MVIQEIDKGDANSALETDAAKNEGYYKVKVKGQIEGDSTVATLEFVV